MNNPFVSLPLDSASRKERPIFYRTPNSGIPAEAILVLRESRKNEITALLMKTCQKNKKLIQEFQK
jgi:hypothetical protein